MIKVILLLFLLFSNSHAVSDIKNQILENIELTDSLKFNFVQKTGKKIEKGNCIIKYSNKILCKYNDLYKKVLVSNGKYLFIDSTKITNYLKYSIDKTFLNIILDKNLMLEQIRNSNYEDLPGDNYLLETTFQNNLVFIFFDKKTLNLKGWSTVDIYQNKVETILSNVERNLYFDDDTFKFQKYIN